MAAAIIWWIAPLPIGSIVLLCGVAAIVYSLLALMVVYLS